MHHSTFFFLLFFFFFSIRVHTETLVSLTDFVNEVAADLVRKYVLVCECGVRAVLVYEWVCFVFSSSNC